MADSYTAGEETYVNKSNVFYYCEWKANVIKKEEQRGIYIACNDRAVVAALNSCGIYNIQPIPYAMHNHNREADLVDLNFEYEKSRLSSLKDISKEKTHSKDAFGCIKRKYRN